jgi:hypothetical protein
VMEITSEMTLKQTEAAVLDQRMVLKGKRNDDPLELDVTVKYWVNRNKELTQFKVYIGGKHGDLTEIGHFLDRRFINFILQRLEKSIEERGV